MQLSVRRGREPVDVRLCFSASVTFFAGYSENNKFQAAVNERRLDWNLKWECQKWVSVSFSNEWTTSALQRGAGLSGSFLFWSASSSDELRWHQRRSVCIWNRFISYVCVCFLNNIHAECMLKDDEGSVMFWVNNLWLFMSHLLQRSFWSITHTHTHTHTHTYFLYCIVRHTPVYVYTHSQTHTNTRVLRLYDVV